MAASLFTHINTRFHKHFTFKHEVTSVRYPRFYLSELWRIIVLSGGKKIKITCVKSVSVFCTKLSPTGKREKKRRKGRKKEKKKERKL